MYKPNKRTGCGFVTDSNHLPTKINTPVGLHWRLEFSIIILCPNATDFTTDDVDAAVRQRQMLMLLCVCGRDGHYRRANVFGYMRVGHFFS